MFSNSAIPPLADNAVHVWRIPLQVPSETLAQCQSLLAPDEQARLRRFHFPADQRRYAVCRASLRRLLLRYLANPASQPPAQEATLIRFQYGPAGKPELHGTGAQTLHFNVSHAADRALIAFARQPLGIDLEEFRTLDYDALAPQALSPQDLATLAQAHPGDKPDTFFSLWTRHEAQAKALGAPVGTHHPEIPVYDLALGPALFAALATLLPQPQIHLLGHPQWTSPP